jgi:S1-C subfamily serine protease
MKRTLESLIAVLALSGSACVHTDTTKISGDIPVNRQTQDGNYDSLDNNVQVADVPALKDASYMVISESKYKDPDGKTVVFDSLGTAVLYKDVGDKSYLATAHHVMHNEDTLYDFFGGKYEKLSEQFYLLDDQQAGQLQSLLRSSSENEEVGSFFSRDSSGRWIKLENIIRVSDEDQGLPLDKIKAKKIKAAALNESKDLAVISVQKVAHQPLVYVTGDAKELQAQNILYVTGWPLGLVKTISQGHVTSANDSLLARIDPEVNFIFDASISPGNSGGGIFAVRDGRFELVGITSAMYPGNDLYIGVKINPISEIFSGDSIRCGKGWKCN